MDTTQPIRVHLGPNKSPLVLYNGLRLNRLMAFTAEAATDKALNTSYQVAGCFPEQDPAPDDSLSNSAYPLRILFGQDANDAVVTYKGRPLPFIQELNVEATPSRCKTTITLYDFPELEAITEELLDLGVTLITLPLPEASTHV